MARILFALDLGAGYGHLTRILPIADWLAARRLQAVMHPRTVARPTLGATGPARW